MCRGQLILIQKAFLIVSFVFKVMAGSSTVTAEINLPDYNSCFRFLIWLFSSLISKPYDMQYETLIPLGIVDTQRFCTILIDRFDLVGRSWVSWGWVGSI